MSYGIIFLFTMIPFFSKISLASLPPIPLEKVNELEYQFKAADIRMFFRKDEKGYIQSFKLQQGGMDLIFEK